MEEDEPKVFRYIFDPLKRTSVKVFHETPSKHRTALHITNLEEQKENFLRFGKIPSFKFTGSVENYFKKKKTNVRFEFLPEAKIILENVRQQYGSGDNFLDAAFGQKLNQADATDFMINYVKSHGLDGQLNIVWTNDLNCSGRMVWHGPNVRFNRPEARKFTLFLKRTEDNIFLRERGIRGLADHEIGTHFPTSSSTRYFSFTKESTSQMRMNNDGLQPWYSNRQKFGLRPTKSYCGIICEEGLAAINTLLQSHVKMLWAPALLYYTACMSLQMSFKELFEHLGTHVCDLEQRWKLVMRVKRLLPDCNAQGGSGQDQCYFEGAVRILRQAQEIDFKLLYAGKICTDELHRIRRIARQDCIRLPYFLKDILSYKRVLEEMAVLNGLVQRVKRPLSCRRASSRKKNKKKNFQNKFRILSSPTRARTLSSVPHPPLLSRRSRSLKCDDN